MSIRLSRRTAPGQSIPLIALLIVVLIAMVGLSVDVGNTYAQQRATVRATNAAALAGMTELIKSNSDQKAGQVIQESLRSNQIEGVYDDPNNLTQSNQRVIRAYYMDSKGNYLVSCNVGSCGTVPSGTTYIEVRVEGTVDTYFARVVQRPTLPVNAKAFAGRCTPTQGVYPIGVQVDNLNATATGFAPPIEVAEKPFAGNYPHPGYPGGLSKRRIFFTDDSNAASQFSWLRWKATNISGNVGELATMLQGDGNIADGFDKGIFNSATGTFTWPDTSQTPSVGYPTKPHEINALDFIYGSNGIATAGFNNAAIQAALKSHIDKQTVMILPLIDNRIVYTGAGSATVYPLQGLGNFLLIGIPGYGTGVGSSGTFMDLAYIGPVKPVACLSTPAVVKNALGIIGSVFVKPSWGLTQAQLPIAYEIIMDVSGSMSWNFEGQGSKNGSINFEANSSGTPITVQCESTLANPVSVPCNGGPTEPWKTVKERRIWVAKDALAGTNGFIDNMRANDSMRIITFSGAGLDKGPGWTSDKAALRTTVYNAGDYNGDRFRTIGGTPGAAALKAAGEVLDSDPPPALPGGYKHVVIYMTDGVANVWPPPASLTSTNTAMDVCPQYGGDNRAINDSVCQYDMDNYTANPKGPRPISAMIVQANIIKNNHPELQLFAIAMAQVNPRGLDEVASDPSYLYLARDSSRLYTVLDAIYNAAVGPCTPKTDTGFIGQIDSTHRADSPPMPSLPAGVYGYVYVNPVGGGPLLNIPWSGPGADPRGSQTNMVPIVTDLNSNLTYSIPPANGLAAGKYTVSGYVNYKAANASPTVGGDGKSRQYSWLTVNGNEHPNDLTFEVKPSDVLGASVVAPKLNLMLNTGVNVCL